MRFYSQTPICKRILVGILALPVPGGENQCFRLVENNVEDSVQKKRRKIIPVCRTTRLISRPNFFGYVRFCMQRGIDCRVRASGPLVAWSDGPSRVQLDKTAPLSGRDAEGGCKYFLFQVILTKSLPAAIETGSVKH